MNFLIYGLITSIFLFSSRAEIASTNVDQKRTKNSIDGSTQARSDKPVPFEPPKGAGRIPPSAPTQNLPPSPTRRPTTTSTTTTTTRRPPLSTRPPSYPLGYNYRKPIIPFNESPYTIIQQAYKPPPPPTHPLYNRPLRTQPPTQAPYKLTPPTTQPLFIRPLPTQSPYKPPYRSPSITPSPSYRHTPYSPKPKIPFRQKTSTPNPIGYNYPKPKIPFNLPSQESVAIQRGNAPSSSGYVYNRPKIPFNLPNHL